MQNNRRQFIKKSLSCAALGLFAPQLLVKAKSTWQDCPAQIYYPDFWYKFNEVFDDFYYMKIRDGQPASVLYLKGKDINSDMLIDLTKENNAHIFSWERFFGRNTIKVMIKDLRLTLLPKQTQYHANYDISSYSWPVKVEFREKFDGILYE